MFRALPTTVLTALLMAGYSSPAKPQQSAVPDFLLKQSPEHIRVMSFNVHFDSIFSDDDPQNLDRRRFSKSAEFERIVHAVDPDIICLQEINPARDPQQIGKIMDAALPLDNGKTWQTHSGKDNFIAARFDLTERASSQSPYGPGAPDFGHAMALVDLPDADFDTDLYLLCTHFQPFSDPESIRARQEHADSIVKWIREFRAPENQIGLPAGTPILILGDLNVYDTDPAHHLTTLVTGDIVNEEEYGVDFAPDWDGTALTDALPSHNASANENYTLRNDLNPFNPGAADRILYTDSVIAVPHAFVLNTAAMGEAELAAAGLQAGDVALDLEAGIYDHLPLVVDIEARGR